MNKDQLKKSLHVHVQLRPPACRLDENRLELKPIAYSGETDCWMIMDVSKDGVTVKHPSGHVTTLGYDHIYKFTSDEPRHGVKHGFLTLHVQSFIQGDSIHIEPNARPGEPVLPTRPQIVEQLVDFKYPVTSGIRARLAARGHRLLWSRPEHIRTRVDLEGYEVVMERIAPGTLWTFRTRDGLVLLKRST